MYILDKITVSIFTKALNASLSNNLSPQLCVSLVSIIAIDYMIRLNATPEIHQYATISAQKLRSFLGQKVITDDSFSTVLMLFSVVITDEETTAKNNNTVVNKQQPQESQDTVLETLIAMHFDDIDGQDKETLKLVFKDLLTGENHYDIMNYIQSEPRVLRNAVMQAMKKSKKQEEINFNVRLEINKILNISAKLEKRTSTFAQAVGKISTAICALGVGALGVVTAGVALSIIVVPVCILAIKYGPKIGEKLGETILNLDSNIKFERDRIYSMKSDLYKGSQQIIEQPQNDIEYEKPKIKTKELQVLKDKMLTLLVEPAANKYLTKTQDKNRER